MKKVIFWVLLPLSMACCNTLFGAENSKSWQSSLTKESYVALDVRTEEEVKENPANGSVNIPIRKLKEHISSLDKSKKILIFCEAGGRAARAKKMLEKKGFSKVINIGSWRDWNMYNQGKK